MSSRGTGDGITSNGLKSSLALTRETACRVYTGGGSQVAVVRIRICTFVYVYAWAICSGQLESGAGTLAVSVVVAEDISRPGGVTIDVLTLVNWNARSIRVTGVHLEAAQAWTCETAHVVHTVLGCCITWIGIALIYINAWSKGSLEFKASSTAAHGRAESRSAAGDRTRSCRVAWIGVTGGVNTVLLRQLELAHVVKAYETVGEDPSA